MISETVLKQIESLANEVAKTEGVQIYDIEYGGGSQGPALRVYIDKEGGIGIDECANVSRGLSALLDEQDPIPGGNYNLEVSSPGLERPLKKLWHFQQAIGKKAWMRLSKSLESFGSTNKTVNAAKQITEEVMAVEGENIKVKVGEEEITIPFSEIEKAKLVFDFKDGKQDKKQGGPKKGPRKK